MGALLALVPARDWLYGGIAAVAAFIAWDLHHKYEVAINYQKTVQAESAQTLAAAQKTITTNDTDYKAKLAAEKLAHANDTLAALQQHNADVARLRAATAAHAANPLLGSAASASPGSPAGTGSAASLSGLPEQAVVCQGLSDALAHDDALLIAERTERDALTGK